MAVACWAAALVSLAMPVSAAPITVHDDRGVAVTLSAPPHRIISMLPSNTEAVCALGACERLVGVDRFSNWPVLVKRLPQLGGLEDAQVERIVSLRPDVVLLASSARVITRLESLGLRVLALEPKSHADTHRVLGVLATALGDAPAGEALWQRIDARITAAHDRLPAGWRGQRVYFEVGAGPYAAGETSFIGETLARLGLGNVVPASLGAFPKLNPEFVLRADPDLVMAPRADLARMPNRPGWRGMRALRLGRQCGFDAEHFDMLVRPGPRMGEAAEAVAECLLHLSPTAP